MDQQISYLKNRKKTDERKVNSFSDPGDNVKSYNTLELSFERTGGKEKWAEKILEKWWLKTSQFDKKY